MRKIHEGALDKEYIIFCDESDKKGVYYSNFYGGLIVGSSHYEHITERLNDCKLELNFYGEVKWEKVTERYLDKYQTLMACFFEAVGAGQVRVRIMFRQNAHQPQRLTREHIENEYFQLYYQFIKHAFGIGALPLSEAGTQLRLYFDQFPDTGEKAAQFKGFLLALQEIPSWRDGHIRIAREDVAEVRSHDHVLLQCLDIVLGAMAFRLNDKHKEKPPGQARRGKRTRAKEKLYKAILSHIRRNRKNFNIGVSTSTDKLGRWSEPYLHWAFQSRDAVYEAALTKRGRVTKAVKANDPTAPNNL